MKSRRISAVLLCLLFLAVVARADDKQPTPKQSSLETAPPMSKETRMDLIHAFNAELVYIRTAFPMGKTGLKLQDGKLTPGGDQLAQLLAAYGPAAKPGDLARITNIALKGNSIHFEINGGPVKRKKWYQRIEVGGTGGSAVPISPSDPQTNNPRGSFVDLVFDRYVPELTPQQLKDLLGPVFDFNSKSPQEAYLETVPPKVKDAIQNHHVLVGMNQEMVIYAKGRAPKKVREKDGASDYEEWIYGELPADVDFVRFVGDEVVRVETMKVGGEKIVRTQKEVDIKPAATVATESQTPKPANAPTLRRPGEEVPDSRTPQSPRSTTSAPPPNSDAKPILN